MDLVRERSDAVALRRQEHRRRFLRELRPLPLQGPRADDEVVREEDLEALPAPARRLMRLMRVPGRPRDWSVQFAWRGLFRRSPRARWSAVDAWQYGTSPSVARVFHMRMRTGLLSFVARDVYIGGRGRMQARLLDRFTVVDASG